MKFRETSAFMIVIIVVMMFVSVTPVSARTAPAVTGNTNVINRVYLPAAPSSVVVFTTGSLIQVIIRGNATSSASFKIYISTQSNSSLRHVRTIIASRGLGITTLLPTPLGITRSIPVIWVAASAVNSRGIESRIVYSVGGKTTVGSATTVDLRFSNDKTRARQKVAQCLRDGYDAAITVGGTVFAGIAVYGAIGCVVSSAGACTPIAATAGVLGVDQVIRGVPASVRNVKTAIRCTRG